MPRYSFATSALQGATPGLGKLASAIGGRGRIEQDAYDKELIAQSRLGQAIASMQANQASAALHDAQRANEDREGAILTARPQAFEEVVAADSGADIPTVRAVRESLRTGTAPQRELMGPATPEGGALMGTISPEVVSAIGQRIKQFLPLLTNVKDMKPDDLAKADEIYRGSRLSDAIIAGQADRNRVAGAQAAAGGKALFHSDSTGAVLDQFTGGLQTDNPMAQSTIGLRKEQAGQARAGAAENYAQAGAANATAGLRRAQTGAIGASGPGGKVPVGYRYVVDPDTNESRLEPIPGGPKDPNAQTGKPLPASAAKGLLENQTNLRRAQTAMQLIEGKAVGDEQGDPNATGWKGYVPGAILNRTDKAGVATRAAIADLGSLVIHDRSGAAVTAAEMPRLAPFIPAATDDPATVRKKLKQFVRNYQDEVSQQVDFFRASGYNVPSETLRDASSAEPAPRPAAQATPAAPGRQFRYIGKE